MNEDILNRIKVIIGRHKSERAYATFINVNQSTLNNQVTGRTGLSYDIIDAILTNDSDISAEWLLRGEGDMLKSSSSVSNVQTNVKVGGNNSGVIGSGHMHGGNDDYIKRLEETVEKQNERIDKLIAIIEKK